MPRRSSGGGLGRPGISLCDGACRRCAAIRREVGVAPVVVSARGREREARVVEGVDRQRRGHLRGRRGRVERHAETS